MDKFDQKILSCLSQDARQSNAEIARQVGLSRSAVSERIHKLENQQQIIGYRVELQPPQNRVAAYFQLTFNQGCCDEIAEIVRIYPQVRRCHSTTGDVDMMIFAEADSMLELNELRNKLELLPRLIRIVTHTVLEERIRR